MFKKALISTVSVAALLGSLVSPVMAGYDDKLPNAACNNGVLKVYFNPLKTNTKVAMRIDDLSNGWNDKTPNSGDVVDNNHVGSAYVYNNAVPGRWYAWWFHRIDANGVYSQPQGGFLQCPVEKLAKPTGLSNNYDYPTITLTWQPVAGAVRYAIRVDNHANGWDPSNMQDGDHLVDHLTTTTFQFKAAKGRAVGWWVHAVDKYGNFSDAAGQEFVTSSN